MDKRMCDIRASEDFRQKLLTKSRTSADNNRCNKEGYSTLTYFSLQIGGIRVKRISLITIILLMVSVAVFAQQAGPPQSAETKQSAQQTLTQGRTNSTQFESTLADLKSRNTSNLDADTYNRLKNELDLLESQINVEQTRIRTRLDRGTKVNPAMFDRVQRLIDQHKAKLAELEKFTG
jgi:hypothetical protein